MAGPTAGLARCEAPGFLSLHGGELLTMDCGASWEVDLRADADCDNPSLRRCHPRYTLGWQHREVNLFRAVGETGGEPPPNAEYVHGYCDVWGKGRLENVFATPIERYGVTKRSREKMDGRRLWESVSGGGVSGMSGGGVSGMSGGGVSGGGVSGGSARFGRGSTSVLLILIRDVSIGTSRRALPRTLSFLKGLETKSRRVRVANASAPSEGFSFVSFDGHRAIATDGWQETFKPFFSLSLHPFFPRVTLVFFPFIRLLLLLSAAISDGRRSRCSNWAPGRASGGAPAGAPGGAPPRAPRRAPLGEVVALDHYGMHTAAGAT